MSILGVSSERYIEIFVKLGMVRIRYVNLVEEKKGN